jgi:hypothetical protein
VGNALDFSFNKNSNVGIHIQLQLIPSLNPNSIASTDSEFESEIYR